MSNFDERLAEERLGEVSQEMAKRYRKTAIQQTKRASILMDALTQIRDDLASMQANPIYGHISLIPYLHRLAESSLKLSEQIDAED